jgi:sphinganine-1-phosphate aldolase
MKKKKVQFPPTGLDSNGIHAQIEKKRMDDATWDSGKMFGFVYHPGDTVGNTLQEVYLKYFYENALNPSLFPSIRNMENETVAMVSDLLHGDEQVVGNLTSGGTESILMVVKVARDKASRDCPQIKQPEIVLPVSAHPAFEKAAYYMGIKTIHVGTGEDYRVDIEGVRKAISSNTILLVGSAPCFPYGVVDPIEELGKLALEHDILFHVDACLGGFMLPFLEKLGYPIPPFDFRIPGVTSISADLHKYGYAPKGASVILYRNSNLRKLQYYIYTDWPGGIFASTAMLGTRSCGPIATAWSVIKMFGIQGYMEMAEEVMKTTRHLREGIDSIDGLHITGNPDMAIFSFTSDHNDIFLIGDEMKTKGWHMDMLQFPDSLHLTVSRSNIPVVDEFLKDLGETVKKTRKLSWNKISTKLTVSATDRLSKSLPKKTFHKIASASAKMTESDKPGKPSRMAAIYGISGTLENRENVHDLVLNVLDQMYRLD